MQLRMYQVDAFTERLFGGNPAAVVPLKSWLPDATLQAIAMENNLSETAFFVKEGDGYGLRWFTPAVEVDLCGHATLATAYVVFRHLEPMRTEIAFRTMKSGVLKVTRRADVITLDLPAWDAKPVMHPGLAAALGKAPEQLLYSQDHLAVYASAADVRDLKPDFAAMTKLADVGGVIVTARGEGEDHFVSRFFVPNFGINEDPVTGRAHCTLTPYWAKVFNETLLNARQISPRVGTLVCELDGERVKLSGRGVLYLEGTINVPD